MQRSLVLVTVLLASTRRTMMQARALPPPQEELVSNVCTLTDDEAVFSQFIEDTIARHSIFEDSSKGSLVLRARPSA